LLLSRAKSILDSVEFDADDALDQVATAADYHESIFAEDAWWDEASRVDGQVLLLGALCSLIRGTQPSNEDDSFLKKAVPLAEALEKVEIADCNAAAEANYLRAFVLFNLNLLEPDLELLRKAASLLPAPANPLAAILASDIQQALPRQSYITGTHNLETALDFLLPFQDDEDARAAIVDLELEIACLEGPDSLKYAESALARLQKHGDDAQLAVETVAYLLLEQLRQGGKFDSLERLKALHADTSFGWYDLACMYALAGSDYWEACKSILLQHTKDIDCAKLRRDTDFASVRETDWWRNNFTGHE